MAAKLKDFKRWMLVRWIDEDMIGVMPALAVVKGYTAYVGAVVRLKWNRGRETYDTEILKMSGESFLKATCI